MSRGGTNPMRVMGVAPLVYAQLLELMPQLVIAQATGTPAIPLSCPDFCPIIPHRSLDLLTR